MAKYIAHASIDENGKISGGSAGDQTGKEICIRTWYSKQWNYVLRLKDEAVRKQFGNNMIDLAKNNNVGYDQNQRNTLLSQAKKVGFDFSKITAKSECDCSSAVTACILGAVYKIRGEAAYERAYAGLVTSGNCATTSTLRNTLTKLGYITAYSSSAYVAGTSKAVYGDIYIKEGSHVVCYIDAGSKVSVSGSSAGTGSVSSEGGKVKVTANLPILKYGMTGEAVKVWQTILCAAGYAVDTDGSFGPDCKDKTKKFEISKGITDTPEQVGPAAWKAGLEILDAVKRFY